MTDNALLMKLKATWRTFGATVLLILMLLVFTAYSVFLALNLKSGIIPDEPYHLAISQQFATSWGIPPNTPTSQSYGEDLQRNPFLGYWLFGRALNVYQLIVPDASGRQQLVFLRMFNILFSVGTVIFTFLLAKQLTKNPWWQLLPVFLVTNTLMFVFLSGGVTYDNPTNMACAAGIYFLVRVLNKREFLTNSLGWMVSLAAASLIKHTALPLVLAASVVWVIYILRNHQKIRFTKWCSPRHVILGVILAILLILNFALYGINLIRYQSLTPTCTDSFSAAICDASVFGVRHQQLALPEKLSLREAFRRGYPDPVRYAFDVWIREMLMRSFGIMAHINYYPIIITYYHIALYWIILLATRFIKKPNHILINLTCIAFFYSLVLLVTNYNTELVYGFKQVALQGRYIFPVLSILFTLYAVILEKVTHKPIQMLTLIATLLLFLYGGPIRFLWYANTVFLDWFI